jgi:hypothetical protein
LGRASPIAAATPYTPLILHINATTTLTLVLLTDTGGSCTLVNSNSNFAAIDLGGATYGAQTFGCPTWSHPGGSPVGNPYTLTTSLNIEATCSGSCANWSLSAELPAAAATGLTWSLGGTALTNSQQVIASNIAYGTAQNESFALKVVTVGIGHSAAAGQVSQAIDFTATDTTSATSTATATLNAEEINEPGISMFLVQDASGVAVAGGAFNASLNLGTVSAFGSLAPGVTRPSVTSSNFTVQTLFDIDVEQGNLGSANYTLQAALAVPNPFGGGSTFELNSVSLTTSYQTITSTGTYATDEAYTLDIVISTAAPGAGGPSLGASTNTIDLMATAN